MRVKRAKAPSLSNIWRGILTVILRLIILLHDAAGFIDGLEDSIILDDAVANYVSVVTKKRFMQWLNI